MLCIYNNQRYVLEERNCKAHFIEKNMHHFNMRKICHIKINITSHGNNCIGFSKSSNLSSILYLQEALLINIETLLLHSSC